MTQSVVLLRLSGMSADEAMAAADALIRDRAIPDLRRLLVVDDTRAVANHAEALRHLLAPGRVPHLVCLLVGAPADPGRLVLPGSIENDRDSAVIWIADPFGVDWPLSASAVALLRPEGGPDGERQMIELLSSVEVFERVRKLAAAMPHGVASPGIRIAEPGTAGAADFPAALADAIERLAAPPAAGHGQDDAYRELAPPARRASRALADNGQLMQARHRCVEASSAADDGLAGLAGLMSLAGSRRRVAAAHERVVATGQALSELRLLVARLLDALPADGALTDRQRQRLLDAGVRLPDDPDGQVPAGARPASQAPGQAPAGARPASQMPPGARPVGRPPSPLATLVELIGESLRGGEPLMVIAGRLALTEARLRPDRGSHQAQLERRCPVALIRRLCDPPRFPRPARWLPIAGAVTGVLAGQAGLVGALAAAVIWSGLTALLALAPRLTGRRLAGHLIVNLAAALAGGLASWALTRTAAPPLALSATCAVLAFAVAVIATVSSWRAQAGTWRDDIRPEEAAEAAAGLTDLIADGVDQLRAAPAELAEAVARARIVVEAIARRMREHAVGRQARDDEGPARPVPSVLRTIVTSFLVDLVAAVVEKLPGRDASDGHADHQWAVETTADLLNAWTEHVQRHGPLAAPSFAVTRDQSLPASSRMWHDAVAATVGSDPRGTMWQLCMPGDLALLNVDADTDLATLSFAPRTTRHSLSRSLPPDTEWTTSGHHAGLLRLVPIKVAAVGVTSWSAHDGQAEP